MTQKEVTVEKKITSSQYCYGIVQWTARHPLAKALILTLVQDNVVPLPPWILVNSERTLHLLAVQTRARDSSTAIELPL